MLFRLFSYLFTHFVAAVDGFPSEPSAEELLKDMDNLLDDNQLPQSPHNSDLQLSSRDIIRCKAVIKIVAYGKELYH